MENKGLDLKSDFVLVRNIICNLTNADVFEKKRLRDNVEARLIYAKILRDVGYPFMGIGKSLNKDHSTIIYYITQFDNMYVTSQFFRDKYKLVKDYLDESKEISFVKHLSREEYKAQAEFYQKQINVLSSNIAKLEAVEKRYRRFDEIIQLMEAKLPVGDEVFLLKKLNSILNSDFK